MGAAWPPVPSLRDLAKDRVFVGGTLNWGYLTSASSLQPPMSGQENVNYTTVCSSEFDITTAENALKFKATQAQQGVWNFSHGDTVVNFAQQHSIKVRAHNLIWVAHNPRWMVQLAPKLSSAEIDNIMSSHIQHVASHFKGRVYSWDVVNEGMVDVPKVHTCKNWTCSLKKTASSGEGVDWTKAGDSQTSYVEKAFRYAHAADPEAKLFYNEYAIHTENNKMLYVEMMLRDLLAKGVPIHGIGMQTHIQNSVENKKWNATAFENVLQRFAKLGLEIHITELNVPVNDPMYNGQTDVQKEQTLASLYSSVLKLCLQNPACKSFETWGFTDMRNSYSQKGLPAPGVFYYDNLYQAKVARQAVAQVLANQWNSESKVY